MVTDLGETEHGNTKMKGAGVESSGTNSSDNLREQDSFALDIESP